MQTEQGLRIGNLGKATGTKPETIRYYEQIGLLPAAGRTRTGNYRTYTHRDVERLGFIRRARAFGFTLDQVRALLGLADHEDHECGAVDTIAREHLEEVEGKIAELEALRRELTEIIGRCGHGTVAECRIIEALSPPAG
jgi:DNA-binding transcriptional MerR regulator